MRKIWMVLFFLFFPTIVFSDVTWKILDVDKNEKEKIIVKTQYKIDGVEVESRYPPLNGQYYWVTSYDFRNFIGKTDSEIQDAINDDIKDFAEELVVIAFTSSNDPNQEVIDSSLRSMTGSGGTVKEAIIKNPLNDVSWKVKTDGTKELILNLNP